MGIDCVDRVAAMDKRGPMSKTVPMIRKVHPRVVGAHPDPRDYPHCVS